MGYINFCRLELDEVIFVGLYGIFCFFFIKRNFFDFFFDFIINCLMVVLKIFKMVNGFFYIIWMLIDSKLFSIFIFIIMINMFNGLIKYIMFREIFISLEGKLKYLISLFFYYFFSFLY